MIKHSATLAINGRATVLAPGRPRDEDRHMATNAVEHDQLGRPLCWCCGGTFDESDLVRLGQHPEVAVCARCARWLNRRARAGSPVGRSPVALTTRVADAGRRAVLRHGIQHWPLAGRLLRRLDQHLP